jgi:hypothetical protein
MRIAVNVRRVYICHQYFVPKTVKASARDFAPHRVFEQARVLVLFGDRYCTTHANTYLYNSGCRLCTILTTCFGSIDPSSSRPLSPRATLLVAELP